MNLAGVGASQQSWLSEDSSLFYSSIVTGFEFFIADGTFSYLKISFFYLGFVSPIIYMFFLLDFPRA